jgi:threonine dehydratase
LPGVTGTLPPPLRPRKIAGMSVPADLPAAAVQAAARRLAGHLVATPLIGGGVGNADVRWKPELLQPGGSGWFRGYQHFLLRKLGSLPGLVFHGPNPRALAAALAAQFQRVPLTVVVSEALSPELGAALQAAGATLEVTPDPGARGEELRRRHGWPVLPGAEDPDVAAGLATIGIELADALPGACRRVFVPADVALAVAAGLGGGRDVCAVTARTGPSGLRQTVATLHRLLLGDASVATLDAALAAGAGETVAAVLIE